MHFPSPLEKVAESRRGVVLIFVFLFLSGKKERQNMIRITKEQSTLRKMLNCRNSNSFKKQQSRHPEMPASYSYTTNFL